MTEKVSTTRDLTVKLSNSEMLEKHGDLVKLLDDRNGLKLKKAEAAEEFGTEISGVELKIAKLLDVLKKGEETRTIPVELKQDFERNIVEVIRLDTFEIVEERAMTSEERERAQGALFNETEEQPAVIDGDTGSDSKTEATG